jgi:hypothetical protein
VIPKQDSYEEERSASVLFRSGLYAVRTGTSFPECASRRGAARWLWMSLLALAHSHWYDCQNGNFMSPVTPRIKR